MPGIIVLDAEDKVSLLIEEAQIIETYRLNSSGFWCVYRTPHGSNDGQFFVSENETLTIYHPVTDISAVS